MDPQHRVRPGQDVSQLIMLSGRDRLLRNAQVSLESIGEGMTGSADIMLGFLAHHANESGRFLSLLDVDLERLREALLEIGETLEAPSEPHRLLPGVDEYLKNQFESLRVLSRPIQIAMRTAREQAMGRGENTFGIGEF